MDWWPIKFPGFILFLILLLYIINIPRKNRHRQYWSPVFAIIYSVSLSFIYFKYYPQLSPNIRQAIDWAMKTLSQWMNLPQPRTAIYLTIVILLGFLAIKFAIMIVSHVAYWITAITNWLKRKIKRISEKPTEKPSRFSIAYGYDKDRGIFLKDAWVYPREFTLFIAVFPMLVLLAVIEGDYYRVSWTDMPALVCLPLLVILEITWYLGGPRPPWKEPVIETQVPEVEKLGWCFGLLQQYAEIWENRLLVNGELAGGENRPYSPDFKEEPEIALVLRNLDHQGIRLLPDQLDLLRKLWQGKDVIVSEDIYLQSFPIVFAALQRDILRDRNVLFLLGTENRSNLPKDLKDWIQRGLTTPFFGPVERQVVGLEGFDPTHEKQVLAASVHDLLDDRVNRDQPWFKDLGTVVVVNIPDTLYEDVPSTSALFRILDRLSQRSLQIIMLTEEDRSNQEQSVREYVTSNPEEYHLSTPLPAEVCYMVWRAEFHTHESFQSHFGYRFGKYVGNGPMLALFAMLNGVEPVHLIGKDQEPWSEFLEEIDKVVRNKTKTIRNIIRYHDMPYIMDPEDRAMIIIYDHLNNIPATLNQACAYGRQGVFAHIISSPYMLREYFADNLDFFMHRRSEPLGTFAPVMLQDKTTVAFYLKELLLACDLEEKDLEVEINRIILSDTESNGLVQDRLLRLFKTVFEANLGPNLTLHEQSVFKINPSGYDKQYLYRLEAVIRSAFSSIYNRFMEIRDADGNVLGRVLEDHQNQLYLPDQVHFFQGKSFRIQSLDKRAGCLVARPVDTDGTIQYRTCNTIELNDRKSFIELSQFEKTSNGTSIQRSLNEVDFKVKTTGYYSFYQGINFSSGYRYVPTSVPSREYRHGRMWEVRIQPPSGMGSLDVSGISKTLALLIKEALVTFFSENYRFLIVTTPYRSRDKNKGDFKKESVPELALDAWNTLVPRLEFLPKNYTNDEKEIIVFVFEDSTIDMGLVNALHKNWRHLFMILEDYLTWQLEHDSGFLAFGLEGFVDGLRLQETKELLSGLVGDLPVNLRHERESFFRSPPWEGSYDLQDDAHICDFCRKPLSDMNLERLDDGRERCPDCKNTVLETHEELSDLYHEARDWLINRYRLDRLRRGILVKFPNTAEIQTATGKDWRPTPGFDARAIGIAIQKGEDLTIMIENGSPYHMTLATVAHELTHIWQFDNLDFRKMEKDYGLLLIEGHASWVEIKCLEEKGIGPSWREALIKRQDEYGQGYHLIVKLMKEKSAPDAFSLLKKMYPIS